MSAICEAVHRHPANLIIGTAIDPGDTDMTTEQLWARRIDDAHYELCCIPFFAYDLALEDVVEVEVDSSFQVTRVSAPSGRHVFRSCIGDSHHSPAPPPPLRLPGRLDGHRHLVARTDDGNHVDTIQVDESVDPGTVRIGRRAAGHS